MRRLIFFGLVLGSALLLGTALGCNKSANKTTPRGVGGLPIQRFDSTPNSVAWEVPKDLAYPNATRRYPDNNRIFLVPDSVDKVVSFYMGKLKDAQQEQVAPKRHVKVKNDEMVIDIQSGGDTTQIAFEPVFKTVD